VLRSECSVLHSPKAAWSVRAFSWWANGNALSLGKRTKVTDLGRSNNSGYANCTTAAVQEAE